MTGSKWTDDEVVTMIHLRYHVGLWSQVAQEWKDRHMQDRRVQDRTIEAIRNRYHFGATTKRAIELGMHICKSWSGPPFTPAETEAILKMRVDTDPPKHWSEVKHEIHRINFEARQHRTEEAIASEFICRIQPYLRYLLPAKALPEGARAIILRDYVPQPQQQSSSHAEHYSTCPHQALLRPSLQQEPSPSPRPRTVSAQDHDSGPELPSTSSSTLVVQDRESGLVQGLLAPRVSPGNHQDLPSLSDLNLLKPRTESQRPACPQQLAYPEQPIFVQQPTSARQRADPQQQVCPSLPGQAPPAKPQAKHGGQSLFKEAMEGGKLPIPVNAQGLLAPQFDPVVTGGTPVRMQGPSRSKTTEGQRQQAMSAGQRKQHNRKERRPEPYPKPSPQP